MTGYTASIRTALLGALILGLTACGGDSEPKSLNGDKVPTDVTPVEDTVSALQQQADDRSAASESTSSTASVASTASESRPSAARQNLSVNGTITYDRVHFDGRNYKGLDYERIEVQPARGVTVQLLDADGETLAATSTDGAGRYQFDAPTNTPARLRVVAESAGSGGAEWNLQVKDNTRQNALYVLEGSLVSTGDSAAQRRDLHAASGWTGSHYGEARSAAPLAILDSLYDALQSVVGADPGIVLPPLDIFWSKHNIAISGNKRDGHIGTSFYTSSGPAIYLLGAADNDSDEYDRAVVQHEFGHYLEHQLGRTESIGGSHSMYSKLDMRVAFGEAWGNAFAGIVSGDPVYRDSLGAGQDLGFAIDVESQSYGQQGWFSEASVQSILYDIMDADSDGADRLNLGFAAVYRVLTSERYLDYNGLISIYPFIALLREQQPASEQAITELMHEYSIYGTGWYGEGETNSGGSSHTLPIYHTLAPGGHLTLCSDSDYQDYNGMDVRRFIKIRVDSTREYTLSAHKTAGGLAQSNPQLRLFHQGRTIASARGGARDSESLNQHLRPGTYIAELYEASNADGDDDNGGLACFEITLN